ncbi:anti-sigma factor domain-containing protein [Sporosarcina highlanderae]|uniref:RsgI N-terminal anti-sigma domain-containing protein n=1 Tax=Sporosarcina highlanderae TaxID=3035916 RepID=A0ABT8JTR3_9BACL|nr:hypothetical protein [Sporosarcina highlanderae]MDN4608528.1 hypothetical protein [Sporosarcina highlanderae]
MMRTYRGIVCEKKNRYMVFLTGNGEFLRGVPIGDPPNVGDEADFKLVASTCSVSSKSKQRAFGAVFVAAALLFLIVSLVSPLNEKVMAYVQLEAETAMEFVVDQQGTVISLRYLNETPIEPEHLSEWKGHALLTVLDMAILEFSVRDKQIIITTVYPTRESKRETNQIIGDAVKEVSVKHDALNLEIAESTPQERKIANKKRMSIHQFKSVQNEKPEKPINVRQPVDVMEPIKEKPIEEQNDALKNPKKENVPLAPSRQKQMDKEQQRLNRTEQQKGPPTEKIEKNPNKNQSGNSQSLKDKKVRPENSRDMNKHSKDNQGPPVKQKQNKPVNEKKSGTGPSS